MYFVRENSLFKIHYLRDTHYIKNPTNANVSFIHLCRLLLPFRLHPCWDLPRISLRSQAGKVLKAQLEVHR